MYQVTSNYGWRTRPNTSTREWTTGTDIVSKLGDNTLYSPVGGQIVNVGVQGDGKAGLKDPSKFKELGWYMDVKTPEGKYVRFGHLDPIKDHDRLIGAIVNPGDSLASYGKGSGSGTGPHVKIYSSDHSDFRVKEDPSAIIKQAETLKPSGKHVDFAQMQQPNFPVFEPPASLQGTAFDPRALASQDISQFTDMFKQYQQQQELASKQKDFEYQKSLADMGTQMQQGELRKQQEQALLAQQQKEQADKDYETQVEGLQNQALQNTIKNNQNIAYSVNNPNTPSISMNYQKVENNMPAMESFHQFGTNPNAV